MIEIIRSRYTFNLALKKQISNAIMTQATMSTHSDSVSTQHTKSKNLTKSGIYMEYIEDNFKPSYVLNIHDILLELECDGRHH